MPHLTKALVNGATAPARGQAFLRDDVITGFALRVLESGAKSFVWEGRLKGRMRRLTIGRYPDLPVAVARQKALEIRAAIGRGEDPSEARHAEHKQPTFGDLAVAYLQRHSRPHKAPLSVRDDEHYLAKLIPQGWQKRRLSDISRTDVERLHAALGGERGHYAANHAIRLLRHMFNLSRDWEMSKGDNPAARITLFKEPRRERYLTPQGIGEG